MFASAPRYETFYGLYEQAGTNLEQATGLLAKLVQDWPDDGPRLRLELKELETQGDRITHDVMHHLNTKAATPFPVSDAHELISQLDDVVDLAEEVADFMGLYRIEAATEQAIDLANVLDQAGQELAAALCSLKRPAIDACRHAGNTLEGLVVKSV
jgi:uncharacterized protein Yka (UPF0111/DUF47 family)